jgi:hypothetical protein
MWPIDGVGRQRDNELEETDRRLCCFTVSDEEGGMPFDLFEEWKEQQEPAPHGPLVTKQRHERRATAKRAK